MTASGRLLVLGVILAAVLVWHDGEAQQPGSQPAYRGRPFEDCRRDLQGGTPMVRERAVVALCDEAARSRAVELLREMEKR